MTPQIRDDRQMRALTGLSQPKFAILCDAFTHMYHQQKQAVDQKAKRQRRPGGGRKGALPTTRGKLIFLLYYLKVYPTYDVLGAQFGRSRSKAGENLHKLMPLLHQTLIDLAVLPHR